MNTPAIHRQSTHGRTGWEQTAIAGRGTLPGRHEAEPYGLAFQILHDQEVDPVLLADVMERADVRMVQARDRLGFPLEPLAEIGIVGHMRQEHLDGDGAVQAGVGGLVDLAHAPSAEGRLDFVGAERGAGL